MADLLNVELKVNPQDLITKSEEVSGLIREAKTCFEELKTIMENTQNYWEGMAGDQHRKLYREEQPDIDEMLRRLEEHPRDLITIAKQYSDTETKLTEMIELELPGNVIV